jgi:hypothetical protein
VATFFIMATRAVISNGTVVQAANEAASPSAGSAVGVPEPFAGTASERVDKVIAATSGGLTKQIEALKKAQADARKARQQLSRELRNAQRRKRRLKTKSRMLSNDDLVDVLMMRREAAAAAAAPEEGHVLAEEVGQNEQNNENDDEEQVGPPTPKAARTEE